MNIDSIGVKGGGHGGKEGERGVVLRPVSLSTVLSIASITYYLFECTNVVRMIDEYFLKLLTSSYILFE